MAGIRETTRSFIMQTFVTDASSSALSDDTNLRESGIVDSFSVFTLVSFVENQFNVQLEAADVTSGRLSSIASIEELVLARIGARS